MTESKAHSVIQRIGEMSLFKINVVRLTRNFVTVDLNTIAVSIIETRSIVSSTDIIPLTFPTLRSLIRSLHRGQDFSVVQVWNQPEKDPSMKPLIDKLSLISTAEAEATNPTEANKANILFFIVVCLFVCLVNRKFPPRGRNKLINYNDEFRSIVKAIIDNHSKHIENVNFLSCSIFETANQRITLDPGKNLQRPFHLLRPHLDHLYNDKLDQFLD